MVSILTMGRVSMAFVFNIMLIGLMVGLVMADSTNHGGHQQQVHSRRLLPNSAATPLPPFRSGTPGKRLSCRFSFSEAFCNFVLMNEAVCCNGSIRLWRIRTCVPRRYAHQMRGGRSGGVHLLLGAHLPAQRLRLHVVPWRFQDALWVLNQPLFLTISYRPRHNCK